MSPAEKSPMSAKSQNQGRQLLRSILRGSLSNRTCRKARPIRFEPLESRQLLAADFFSSANWLASQYADAPLNDSAYYGYQSQDIASSTATGLVGEGEDAQNLVEFAKALQQSGARFFGADWCPLCTEQKNMFKDGKDYLPFLEMTNPDRTRNSVAIAENITEYPTWEFSNGTRVTGVKSLAELATLSGIAIPMNSNPSIAEIPNQTVLNNSPLHVPVNGYDPSGGPLTITVTSSNPSVISAELISNTKSLRLEVNGYGEMIFRLFEDEAPRVVQRIEQLVNSGFYNQSAENKIIFHRIIDNFMIQTGDPTGTGAGGSSLGNFDDQFNLNLQHNRRGVLSYAKSGDDTNDSQFFITEGPTRHLDFNHSIFGQLVDGEAVREGISRTTVGSNDRPVNEISINKAEIFNDLQNGLIRLKALGTSGTATITVTVTNSAGLVATQTFQATGSADTANGGPFLADVTVPANIPAGQPTTIQLQGIDKEGDPIFYQAERVGSVNYDFTIDNATGLLSITPPANYTGPMEIIVAVRPTSGSSTTQDLWDRQRLTFNVGEAGAIQAPTSVSLDPASDTGASNSDGITNAATMTFIIQGTTAGATVNLMVGSDVVGTAVATGATTTITTTQIASRTGTSHAVFATQTRDGQTSAASPTFTVVYDSTAPASILPRNLPGFAKIDTLLEFDLSHPDEGNGLIYSLDNPPQGMTVDAATGVIRWTPTTAQLGAHNVQLRLSDLAGNSRTQQFEIHVADQALVSVRLVPSDADGNPLSAILLGQEFYLRVIVTDLRSTGNPAGDGVFSAYMDIEYDSNIFELVGTDPITYSPNFANGHLNTDFSVPGLINEMGGFSIYTAGPGREPQVLAAIAMKAKAGGQGNITTNPAETPGHGMAIFKVFGEIPSDLVNFEPANIAVGQDFVAVNDSFNFDEDTQNNILDVLANDTIVAGSGVVLTIDTVSTPSNGGSVTIAPDGKRLVYSPAPNYFGIETFTYTVKDQSGKTGTATVTIQVNPVNDNPVAMPDTFTHVKAGDQNVFLDVLSNDTMGPDTGETLVVTSVGTTSQGGTATVASAGTGIVYTPRAGFTGTETFTYTISDGHGGTSTATVTVVIGTSGPTPTANNDTFTILEDAAAAEYDVLANDTPAAAGETLTIVSVSAPRGTASVTSNGTRITYKPKADDNGVELVTYTIRSSNGAVATGTITFNITPVNDPPNAVDDFIDVLSAPNQIVDVLANDTNVDQGETLTITQVTQPASGQGTVQISADGKRIIYNPPSASYTGTVTFTYTVSDGSLTDTANVTLRVLDYIPRDVGVVFNSNLKGVQIVAEHRSSLGSNAITNPPVVMTGSGAMVKDVGPGEVRFSVPDLPFLSGSNQTVVVHSQLTDGDSLATPFNVGTRDVRSLGLRDLTGRNLANGLTAAVSPNQKAHWFETNTGWNTYSNVSVEMNNAGSSVTIKATNGSNQQVQTTLNVGDSRVEVQAENGSSKLIRLRTTPASLFTTTTPANGTLQGEGESSSAAAQGQLNPGHVDAAIADLAPFSSEDTRLGRSRFLAG